jgi:drug/metabolite transporter (DMT)-like permease
MVLSAVAFALMTSCARAVRDDFSWQAIAFARAGLVLIFALGLAGISGTKLVFLRPKSLWLRSMAGSTSLLLSFYAISRGLPVTDFLALTHMYPIWVAVLSWPLLREKPGRDVWIAIATGLCGVKLISQAHFDSGSYATLVALASSFTSAVSVIGLHRVKGVDARAVVVHFSAVALVFVGVAMLILPNNQTPHGPDQMAWLQLLGVGVFATIGQVLLTKAFAAGSPSRVAIAGLTQVGFGMICDTLFFAEEFDRWRLIGIALVMTPTAWLVATRNRRKREELEEEAHAATT